MTQEPVPSQPETQPTTSLLVESSDANEIVSVVLAWPISSQALTVSEAGLASFTHRMLRRGTKRQGSQELAESIDSLGISISTATDENYSRATLTATTDTWREGLEILREILLEPAFEPEEIEKERVHTLAGLKRADDDLMDMTVRAWDAAAFPNHPLGQPSLGTPQTVADFTRSQVTAMHEILLSNPVKFASFSGRITEREASGALESLLWKADGSQESVPPVPPPQTAEVQIQRDSNQAFLFYGVRICPYGHPDWVALRVMNTILGEGMSSRLFIHLRDEQGLAYATGSVMSGVAQAGTLRGYIGTKPESLKHAREEMARQFERIQDEVVPEDELDRARKYLVGRFLIDHQTNARRAFYPVHFGMMGLGTNYGTRYPELVHSITAEDVQRVARKWLSGPAVVAMLEPSKAEA